MSEVVMHVSWVGDKAMERERKYSLKMYADMVGKKERNFIYKISFKHSNKSTLSLYYWAEFLGLTRSRLPIAPGST